MANTPDDRSDLQLVGDRIRVSVQSAGGNASVSEKSGVPVGTLNNYIAGKTEPGALKLAAIAKATNRSVDFFLTGRDAAAGDLVTVPRFDLRASAAGASRALVPDQMTFPQEVMSFSATWLRRLGVDPQHAELLIAQGDSMEPTIRDGDMMLLNRAIRTVETAGIYVVTVGGMIVVKRAFVRPLGDLVLKSDNAIYPDEVIKYDDLSNVTIEGRVRWAGRAM